MKSMTTLSLAGALAAGCHGSSNPQAPAQDDGGLADTVGGDTLDGDTVDGAAATGGYPFQGNGVGCTPHDRDPVDTLAVNDALNRTGGYIDYESNLGVPAVPSGSTTRTVDSIGGYPSGHELGDSDADGLTDLEEWIYGL